MCWLCTTPFGRPVVPLVYAIAAGANGSTATSGAPAGSAADSSSAHALDGSPGSASSTTRTAGSAWRAASIAAAAARSPTNTETPASSSTYSCSGRVSARFTPTHTAPRCMVARNATTSSVWLPMHPAIRSPGCTPHPANAGRPADLVVERPVGEAGVAPDHCLGVGPSCHRGRQRFGQRLRADRELRAARGGPESVGRWIGCCHS